MIVENQPVVKDSEWKGSHTYDLIKYWEDPNEVDLNDIEMGEDIYNSDVSKDLPATDDECEEAEEVEVDERAETDDELTAMIEEAGNVEDADIIKDAGLDEEAQISKSVKQPDWTFLRRAALQRADQDVQTLRKVRVETIPTGVEARRVDGSELTHARENGAGTRWGFDYME
jgi:hypothetical protein